MRIDVDRDSSGRPYAVRITEGNLVHSFIRTDDAQRIALLAAQTAANQPRTESSQ